MFHLTVDFILCCCFKNKVGLTCGVRLSSTRPRGFLLATLVISHKSVDIQSGELELPKIGKAKFCQLFLI